MHVLLILLSMGDPGLTPFTHDHIMPCVKADSQMALLVTFSFFSTTGHSERVNQLKGFWFAFVCLFGLDFVS